MSAREPDGAERQLVDLVKSDYDATQRALSGFVSSGGQLRAIGIGAWGVVFAVAVQAESSAAAAVAALLAVGFAVIDGYHSALYRQMLARARSIEGLLGDYHNSLGINARNTKKVLRARAQLEQHAFGVHRNMQPINKMRSWWIPRPLRVTWIYAVLIVVAVGAAVDFQIRGTSRCQGYRRTNAAVLSGSGAVRHRELPLANRCRLSELERPAVAPVLDTPGRRVTALHRGSTAVGVRRRWRQQP